MRRVLIPVQTVLFCLALLYAAVKLLSWSETSVFDVTGDRRALAWVAALFVWHAVGWLAHILLLYRLLHWQFGERDVNVNLNVNVNPSAAPGDAAASATGSINSALSQSSTSQQQPAHSSDTPLTTRSTKTLSESSDSSSDEENDSDYEHRELLKRHRAQRTARGATRAPPPTRRKRLDTKELKKKKEKKLEKKLRMPPLIHLWKIACLMRDDLLFLIPGFIFLVLAAIGAF